MANAMIQEHDVRHNERPRYFYRDLPIPIDAAELKALIHDVIGCSPGNKYDSVVIRREGYLELADAHDFINACHRLTIDLCQMDASLPAPASLDGSRRHGTISTLTELLAWCHRAAMILPSKHKGLRGRPPASKEECKQDAAIAAARAGGFYPRNRDLAEEFKVSEEGVALALDRHRKRMCRAGKAKGPQK